MAQETFTAQAPRSTGRVFLYGGLALGLAAAVFVALALSNGKDDAETTTPAGSAALAPVAAVAAAQDIPAGTRITPDMLKVGFYEPQDIDPEAFGTVGAVANRVTAVDVVSGQVITPPLVSTSSGESLTFTVSQGMRAISIEVEEVVTAGGNVLPGDHVDLIGVFELDDSEEANLDVAQIASGLLGEQFVNPPMMAGGRKSLTLTLLQDVRILAVDQALPPSEATTETTAGVTDDVETNPKASTVTLEVTPDKAQILALADEYAVLRLSLRPFGEDVIAPVVPIVTGID